MPDLPLVARGEPDGAPDLLAEQRGHAAGGRPRSQAPRFEHHHAGLGQPGLVEQAEGDDRRLAGARRGLEDGGRPRSQGRPEVVDDLLDGQDGRHPVQESVMVPVARSITCTAASMVITASSGPTDSR